MYRNSLSALSDRDSRRTLETVVNVFGLIAHLADISLKYEGGMQQKNEITNDNILATAANAFRSGKITQQQYFQIMDALNQCDASNAGNQEIITAKRLLGGFR